MYLESHFKCLPSVFLEVAIFTLVWVFPLHYFFTKYVEYTCYFPYYRNAAVLL